ncbi:MAG TPA: chaperone modulator CbpM [Burkholderiaceae bacterium]|nr:chaperone modulator CbpM [Burkholderiaceae bacterium]
MKTTVFDSVWLSDVDVCSAKHLIEVSGLSREEFDVLVEIGVIVPISDNDHTKAFQLHYVVTANTARKLRDDFELDLHGMALAMTLMRRIDELQKELNAARA